MARPLLSSVLMALLWFPTPVTWIYFLIILTSRSHAIDTATKNQATILKNIQKLSPRSQLYQNINLTIVQCIHFTLISENVLFCWHIFLSPLCILSRLVSLSKEFQENPICRLRDGESFLGRIVITMFPIKKTAPSSPS